MVPARDGSGFKANYKAIYTTLLEVALALRYLASMAVTHCDVKPANILLRSSPRDPRGFTAKLADFGWVGRGVVAVAGRGRGCSWLGAGLRTGGGMLARSGLCRAVVLRAPTAD